MSRVLVRAPSNIALIKYMGKSDANANLPANSSLSLTLENFCTLVEARKLPGSGAEWTSGGPDLPTRLAQELQEYPLKEVPVDSSPSSRVIRHIERVRAAAPDLLHRHRLPSEVGGRVQVRTANTFPASSGLASSASSFSALTLAVMACFANDPDQFWTTLDRDAELRRALARLSRQGSGSSCRSFEGPWVLWENESAAAVQTRMPPMSDLVILIQHRPKLVSSSEAHRLVQTSPLWEGRLERVSARLKDLESALAEGDLRTASRISWAEMWEMHSLFHTCAEPFTYWEPGTLEVLNFFSQELKDEPTSASPIVTMDAGANVHVLVPQADRDAWFARLSSKFPTFRILSDQQGSGARGVAC